MRAYSSLAGWLLLGSIALACSGASFSSGNGGEAGAAGDGGSNSHGGALNRAGRGGSSSGKAGTTSTSGSDAGGSDVGGAATGGTTATGGTGTAGDVNVGGDVSTAGTPSVGGHAGTMSTGGSAGTNSGPPVDEVCPKNQPSNGGLCKENLWCSYGNDLRAQCRNLAKCTDGKWVLTKPDCAELKPCEALLVGGACMAGTPDCALDAGVFCVCAGCKGGGVCANEYEWACAGGQGGAVCPKAPPNFGHACMNDMTCPYGSCTTGGNITATCGGGVWNWELSICPR